MQRLARAILPFFAAAASLFLGLVPTLLDHGRFEPLDWLVPGFAALAVLRLVGGAGAGRAALHWALVALPPVLIVWLSAMATPWPGLALLDALLAAAALLLARARRRTGLVVLAGAALAVALRLGAWLLAEPSVPAPPTNSVAVMTALPLFRSGEGNGALGGVGVRAPVINGLAANWRPEPIDLIDGAALAGFGKLLLAHPRLLAPAELVALDNWVRAGGEAVILADPLLRWPGEQALTDPRRPPLTSLLDPLMTHWGLTLEPARLDAAQPVERRRLTGGAMVQLAGASHFTLAPGAPCTLAEGGLIAYCRIGKGKAVLVADADWIDDRLWTLAPARPRDARAWTSDALPLLSAMIAGDAAPPRPSGAWLSAHEALVSALRWALALILALSILLARFMPRPMISHGGQGDFRVREKESGEPPPDSA